MWPPPVCGNRCGPCKLILPQLVEMAEELKGRAHIVKFNCNKYNKELGISLGIKVAPTFLLYKGGDQVSNPGCSSCLGSQQCMAAWLSTVKNHKVAILVCTQTTCIRNASSSELLCTGHRWP